MNRKQRRAVQIVSIAIVTFLVIALVVTAVVPY